MDQIPINDDRNDGCMTECSRKFMVTGEKKICTLKSAQIDSPQAGTCGPEPSASARLKRQPSPLCHLRNPEGRNIYKHNEVDQSSVAHTLLGLGIFCSILEVFQTFKRISHMKLDILRR